MSVDIYVLLNKSSLPSVKTWQSALNSLGTSVTLDDAFDPFHDSGFVPCKFGTTSTGFEFFLETRDGLVGTYPQLADHMQNYDSGAVFSWSSDMKECAAAISAAAALATVGQGIMYDPQEDAWFGVPDAREYAVRTVAEIGGIL
jgi:hypothetical protein